MSGAEILILGKLLLTFGFLLGFAAWEVLRLRRDLRRRRAGSETTAGDE